MNINDILSEESILVDFNASSKKHVLDALSKLAQREIEVSHKTILDNLIKREKEIYMLWLIFDSILQDTDII